MSSGLTGDKKEAPRIAVFGFPFTSKRVSPFTGGKEGPIVIEEFLQQIEEDILLISRSSRDTRTNSRIYSIDESMMFNGATSSAASLDAVELENLSRVELLAEEMLGRSRALPLAETAVGGIGAFDLRRNQIRNKLAYWNEFVRDRNVSGWVNSNAPHFVDDYICYEICRLKGVPTVFPYRLPIVPGVSARLYIPLGLFDHSAVYLEDGTVVRADDISEELINQPLPEDLELIYNEVVLGGKSLSELSRETLTSLMMEAPAQFRQQPQWFSGIKARLKSWWTGNSNVFRLHQDWQRLLDTNTKDYKELATDKIPGSDYLYYPLHMQPEASSCPLGGVLSDQLRAVRLLAETLPADWKLVIKEHPLQRMEARPAGWYRELVKSPNVVLVTQEVSSADLQKGARAVATLTGASAWEAWLWRKPALVLGHILYQDAPGIYKVRSRQDAKDALGKIAAGVVHDNADIRRYLGCLAHMTFFGHLDAYINPCLPSFRLSPEENERNIGRRLAAAYRAQLRRTEQDVVVAEMQAHG